MKKKSVKILSIVAGIVFLLFLVANFGLNFWIKNNLDDYIKKNSDYIVSYKSLNVDLGTGNILANGVTINNKNPQNLEILGLQGTVDSLSVARLGIYDIIFNKKISTSNLILSNPNLNIILPLKNEDKKKNKQSEIILKNIKISNGNIQVFKPTKQKLFSVKDFNLKIENLELNEETRSEKLPFTFDEYEINGKNFFFRPNNIYAITASSITTKEGQMNMKDFAVNPLLSYANFIKYYPNKPNLFDVKASEIEFKDFDLKNDRIALSKVRLENPDLKMFTSGAKKSESKKPFSNDIQLEDFLVNNAKINILKPNGSALFTAGNLNLNINKVLMNEETAKGKIPFQYADFKIKGQKINYVSNTQNINIANISVNPKSVDLRTLSVKPTVSKSDKTLMDLDANQLYIKINEFAFVENKLKLNLENVLINKVNGKILGSENPKKSKKPSFDGLQFPLIIKNINLKNSNLVYDKKSQPLVFNDLNANIQNIEINEKTSKEKLPFKIGFYSLTTRNFNYKTKFYNLSSSLVKLSKNTAQISNFKMLPTVSRAQFIRMIPAEKDLYDLAVKEINMKGNWDFLSSGKFLDASNVTLTGMNANIFRSKIPKDDLSEKPLYSKLLRSIKFPMFINDLQIKNSVLIYEEDTKKSEGPGKLVFDSFNLDAKNINSGKMKGKPTKIPITIRCNFMDASTMKVNWNLDTASQNDAFSISGSVLNIPAARINPFIEPYLKIRATGQISSLLFDFKGNKVGLNGTLKMKHTNLKVSILKETGKKDKILSAIANIFVKTDSGKYPESVMVEGVERDPTKSFFNLFWKGIEQGLKRTLIGKNLPETEEAVKNTVGATKTTIANTKEEIKEVKSEVNKKVEKVKSKGVFQKIFKKKSEK